MADNSDTIAQGLFAIAKSIDGLAKETGNVALWLKYLGNGDAASTMGAIEHLSVSIIEAAKDSAETQASALEGLAEQIGYVGGMIEDLKK